MANFLRHVACPECHSKDNLAIYDDDSAWCFGCGFYRKGSQYATVRNKVAKENVGVDKAVHLPVDFETVLPANAELWLSKYELTENEIENYGIGYSMERELLITPIYDDKNHLLMWQGRYFGKVYGHPKYITKGDVQDVAVILDNNFDGRSYSSDSIVMVEDYISAIKVGRVAPCLPLFGSVLSTKLAARLRKMFGEGILWLDYDKRIEAYKQAVSLGPMFDKGIRTRITTGDPKTHSNIAIRGVLQGAI